MTYSNWEKSFWLIFWRETEANTKSEEHLACWYMPDLWCYEKPSFGAGSLTYVQVKDFLESPNWSLWANLEERDHQSLIDCMKQFIEDVDRKIYLWTR